MDLTTASAPSQPPIKMPKSILWSHSLRLNHNSVCVIIFPLFILLAEFIKQNAVALIMKSSLEPTLRNLPCCQDLTGFNVAATDKAKTGFFALKNPGPSFSAGPNRETLLKYYYHYYQKNIYLNCEVHVPPTHTP